MSKTVDQRVVEMRFDNAQFERGIAQSLQSLKNLKESLDFSHISDAGLTDLSKDIGNIGTSVDSIANKFSLFGIAGTTAVAKITNSMIDLGMSIKDNLTKNMEEGYNKYNIMMESIQTIMYGTRDQIGEGLKWATQEDQMDYVSSLIEKLNWYTDETSYNLTDMTNNLGKFVAAGVNLDDAAVAMMGISSWAAISGQNAEAASRAMYNLSQALAIGKVTVADWKSIELANMATTEFKHTVADLAFEMGKLYETEEGWYATLDDKGKEVLVSYDGLRQSLSAGWFDNEVLTAVLKLYGGFADDLHQAVEDTGLTATEMLRYTKMYKKALSEGQDMTQWVIDIANDDNISNYTDFGDALAKLSSEENELGRQAFMAAQECKTFKDVMLATEDAATSAWMGIYTAIFGNYLQSKELWSAVAEEMYTVLVEGVAAKRNLLQEWNDIGGRDSLINGLWNIWYNVRDIMDAFGDAFNKWVPEKSAEQLAELSKEFEKWTKAIRFTDFDELIPGWTSHLDKLAQIAEYTAQGIRHIIDFFTALGTAAAQAWERIFPSDAPWMTINRILNSLVDLSRGFEDFTSTLFFSESQLSKLERTFAGLFAILDIGRMFLVTLLEPLTNIKIEAEDIKDPILDVTAAIGDWLVALRDWIKEHNYFSTLISWAMNLISSIPGKVESVLQELFGIGIQDLWEMIKLGAYYAAGAVYLLFTNLPKWANEATKLLFGTDLKGFWEMLKGWVVDTWEHVKEFFTGTAEKANEVGKSKAFTMLLDFWEKLKEFVITSKITIWDFCTGIPGYINLASKLLFKTDLHTFWENFVGWIKDVGDAVVNLFTTLIPGKVNELCKYITGSDLPTIWEDLKLKVSDTGETVKEFFKDIPNKVNKLKESFENSKVFEFWTKFKIKVGEVWNKAKEFFLNVPKYANDLSIKLFGTDIETWWDGVCKGAIKAFEVTKQFFIDLPANIDYASKTLFKSDFPTFWENTKTNAKEAWDNVVGFFTSIPEKANAATQFLFGTDLATWWNDVKISVSGAFEATKQFFTELPAKMDAVTKKLFDMDLPTFWNTVKENGKLALGAIVLFFTTIPQKANEASQALFGSDIESWWKSVCENIVKAYEAVRDFFTTLPAKADEVSKKLFNSDFKTFWVDTKTNAKEAWNNVVGFFTSIPEKANAASQALFGTDIATWWDTVCKSVVAAFIAVKDFFATLPGKANSVTNKLFGTDFLSWWNTTKKNVSETFNNIVKFFKGIPGKANEASNKLFGTDLATWWTNLCTNIAIAFNAGKEFFTTLPEKVNNTTQKLFKSDFPTWWDNVKTFAREAKDNVVAFFESIPEKANNVTLALFDMDLETWWQSVRDWAADAKTNVETFFTNLPTYIDNAKTSLNEFIDTVKKLFNEDIPAKLDEISQYLFHKDFEGVLEDICGFIDKIKQAVVDFFGWGEGYDEEKTIHIPGVGDYTYIENESGLHKLKREVNKFIEDMKETFGSWEGFVASDFGEWLKNLGSVMVAILAIGSAIFGLVKVAEAVKNFRTAFNNVSNAADFASEQGFWGNFLGGFINPFKDTAEACSKAAKSTAKFATIKMIADAVLEVAAGLAILALMDPDRLTLAFVYLGAMFGGIMAFVILMSNDEGSKWLDKLPVDKILKVATFFDMMAGAMITIAAALWIVATIEDPVVMGAAVLAIGTLFGAMLGVIIAVNRIPGIKTDGLKDLGIAMDLMSGAMVAIAAAMWSVGVLDIDKMTASALAIGGLFGSLVGAIVVLSRAGKGGGSVDVKDIQKIAEAILIMSASMVVISVALLIAGQVPIDNLVAATIAISAVFGAIAGALVLFSNTQVDPNGIVKIGSAILLMGVAIAAIGFAFMMMQELSPEQILLCTFALTTLMTAMSGIMIGLTYAGAAVPVMLAFGGAVALVGAGAMMAGVGIWLVADGFEKMSNISPKGMSNIINGIKEFFAALPYMATKVVEAIVAFCEAFTENSETIKEGVLTLVDIILSCLELALPRLLTLGLSLFKQFLAGIVEAIPDIENTIRAVLTMVFNLITGYVPMITELALQLLVDTLQRIANHIGEITSLLIQIVLETILGTIDGITAEIPHIIESVWTFWITLINSFADGLDAHAKELKDALEHLWDSCIKAAKTFFGIGDEEPEFLKIARDIIDGFIKGITDFAGGAINAITTFGSNIINAFRGEMDSNSPSKVFMSIGKDVDEGFAIGVDKYADVAIASTEDMAQGSIDAVSSAISSISDMVTDEMDADPVIRPVLDLTDVANGASMIGGMFGDQSMALAMNANTGLTDNAASQFSVYSAFEDLKATLNGLNKSSNGVTNNNVFNITGNDPKEIADAVSEILQNQVERTGAVWGS